MLFSVLFWITHAPSKNITKKREIQILHVRGRIEKKTCLVFYRFNFENFPHHNPSHHYSTIILRCFQQNENIFCGYECIWYEILDKLFYAIVRRLLTTATFLLPNFILGRSFFIIDSLNSTAS